MYERKSCKELRARCRLEKHCVWTTARPAGWASRLADRPASIKDPIADNDNEAFYGI